MIPQIDTMLFKQSFADDQVIIAPGYEDFNFMNEKLRTEY